MRWRWSEWLVGETQVTTWWVSWFCLYLKDLQHHDRVHPVKIKAVQGQTTVASLLGVKAKFNLKCWYELVMTHYKYTLITYTVWLLVKVAAVPFYSSLTRMMEFSQWLMARGPMLQEYVCMSVALITQQCYHNGIIHKIIYNHIWFTKYFYCNKKMNKKVYLKIMKFKISHIILYHSMHTIAYHRIAYYTIA